jgi:arginase family enzyme
MFKDSEKQPYWISFDIDGIDSAYFKSTGTPEGNGIKPQFMMKFLEAFLPEAIGMDFTEVNFALTNGLETEKDKQAVRGYMEHIFEVVQNRKFAYAGQLQRLAAAPKRIDAPASAYTSPLDLQ